MHCIFLAATVNKLLTVHYGTTDLPKLSHCDNFTSMQNNCTQLVQIASHDKCDIVTEPESIVPSGDYGVTSIVPGGHY